jgi:hypothetical protein
MWSAGQREVPVIKQEHHLRDFDKWVSLASSDPDGFERMRRALIEQFIQRAPEARRHRLRCLQWRIDQERARSKTPLAACIRLSRMMWERVTAEGGLVDHLQQLGAVLENGDYKPIRRGQVIPFTSRCE